MNDFVNYLNSKFKIDNINRDIFSSLYNRIEIKKDEILTEPGKKTDKVFFVFSGFMRSFSIDSKGKEHTLQFAIKYSWISDYISLYNNQNSKLYIQAISDCVVFEFRISSIYKLCAKYHQFSSLYRKSLEEHIAALGTRLMNQLQLSADERYNMFLKTYPGVDQLAMNYHIASFLGVTQQSLSRIRAGKKN